MANQYLQYKDQLAALGCEVKADEPMKNHTSFKIGGTADLFVTVSGREQLVSVIDFIKRHSIPLLVLGNGAYLLVSVK